MSSASDVDAKLDKLIPLLSPDQKQGILGQIESMLGGRSPGGLPGSDLVTRSGVKSPETAEELRRIIEGARADRPGHKKARARDLRSIVGAIPHEDLDEMTRVIEEDCERIDPHGW